MNKFHLIEGTIGLISLFFSLFSNDQFANFIYSISGVRIGQPKPYDEMNSYERWAKGFLSLIGMGLFFYLTIWPFFAPDQLGELRGYEEAERCISNSCSPQMCVDDFDKNFSSFPDSKKLHEELKISHTPEACNPPKPLPSPPSPENRHEPVLPDPKVTASDTRLAVLEAAAEKWRSRTGPIHENLADLLGSITAYDQNRFDKQPEAKEAWDYLQSIENVIQNERFGLTQQNKGLLAINVDVTGTGDIGDRAARALDNWLEANGFNNDKSNPDIYIEVQGSHTSNPDPYTVHASTTSLTLSAKWLNGIEMFPNVIVKSKQPGGSRNDAENNSFTDAVSKMIANFQAQSYK